MAKANNKEVWADVIPNVWEIGRNNKFVKDIKITNGLGTKTGKVANGAGCLAASMIAHFKTEAGNVYLHSCEEEEGGWEEYIYTLYPKEGEPTWISIYKTYGDEVIFVGKADKLIKKYAEPVENWWNLHEKRRRMA